MNAKGYKMLTVDGYPTHVVVPIGDARVVARLVEGRLAAAAEGNKPPHIGEIAEALGVSRSWLYSVKDRFVGEMKKAQGERDAHTA